MPRTKQFNVDEAVTKAMHVFWKHGYGPTSMQDLVDSMGIGRGSIYGTFGNKHGLFVRALRVYIRGCCKSMVAMSASTSSPAEAISNVFESAIRRALDDGSRDGCFLVNTALELAPHDQEVAKLVANAFADVENVFRTLIARGQEVGEVRRDVDPDRTARLLLSLMIGLRVLERSRPEEPLLRAIKYQAEALLR
jgi:TetR/AcrR family transcriptional repressor of nem operon